MKLILLTISIFLSLQYSQAQTINWQEATNWKLYDIREEAGLRYPADTLHFFNSISLSDDTVYSFLKQAKAWPKTKYAIWMGAVITSCELGHKLRKIDISMYGGFLFDEQSKQYYELPVFIRNAWMEYINTSMERLPAPKF